MTQCVFSMPMPLDAAGPSRPLTQVHHALKRVHGDDYTLLEPSMFPQLKDPGRLGDAIGGAWDDVARTRLPVMYGGGLFLGGGGASYRQMDELHEAGDVVCGTLWFSSHWQRAQRVLTEEYANFGVQANPIHPYAIWRAQVEQKDSDFMIVPSEYCKSTYPKHLQSKIHVADFGVDAEKYTVKPKRESDALQILYPATNPYRKGVRYVMQAWPKLPASKYQLTITGTPVNVQWPTTTAPIISTGWVPDDVMKKFYDQNDVLLLPSLEEGQALASLEAMACGMPVIVTPEVGIPIEDGKQGIVVESRNPKAIQDALTYLQENEYQYHRMSDEARKFATNRPWSKFQDRVNEIIREVTT